MSRNGQASAIRVDTYPMARGTRFEWHSHGEHQLVWARAGVLIVATQGATWVLPPTRALWIPAGTAHETLSSGKATLRTLYLRPSACPVTWSEPTPVGVGGLLAELLNYLDHDVDGPRRAHAEALFFDLLSPVAVATIEAPFPTDERARDVAQALAADPSDGRSLDDWGRKVGASGRTLARAFLRDTGVPFGRWRVMLRLNAALPALAAGEPVANVAGSVGYRTPSAFVAAFRRETGVTPGAYFRDK